MAVTLTELVVHLSKLKAEKENLETDLKRINANIKIMQEKTIPTLMEEQEIKKAQVVGYGTIYLTPVTYVSLLAENRVEAYKWFKDNGHEIVSETVHPKTLTSWVINQLDNNVAPPEFLKVTLGNQARLRRT